MGVGQRFGMVCIGSTEILCSLKAHGIKNFQLALPATVKPPVLSLAQITEDADPEERKLFRETIRGLTPSELCGWILVDALRRKDLPLLTAAHTLGIDSLAIDSYASPFSSKKKKT